MQNGGSNKNGAGAGDLPDLEKQGSAPLEGNRQSLIPNSTIDSNQPAYVTIVISEGESCTVGEPVGKLSKGIESPKKGYLSRAESSHEQCRVCQQEKEEVLMDLGCQCRGGLAKAHRSCIDTWFRTRGSNKCEICQDIARHVPPPGPQPTTNYWVWRIDPTFSGSTVAYERRRGYVNPLWVAFSILIGGLLLDVLISVTLGVSALPINIIIGVIVVLGFGTALRLAVEFCHDWGVSRTVERDVTNVELGYHPAQ